MRWPLATVAAAALPTTTGTTTATIANQIKQLSCYEHRRAAQHGSKHINWPDWLAQPSGCPLDRPLVVAAAPLPLPAYLSLATSTCRLCTKSISSLAIKGYSVLYTIYHIKIAHTLSSASIGVAWGGEKATTATATSQRQQQHNCNNKCKVPIVCPQSL